MVGAHRSERQLGILPVDPVLHQDEAEHQEDQQEGERERPGERRPSELRECRTVVDEADVRATDDPRTVAGPRPVIAGSEPGPATGGRSTRVGAGRG